MCVHSIAENGDGEGLSDPRGVKALLKVAVRKLNGIEVLCRTELCSETIQASKTEKRSEVAMPDKRRPSMRTQKTRTVLRRQAVE